MSVSMTWPQYKRREATIDGWTVKLSGLQCNILFILLVRRQFVKITDIADFVYPAVAPINSHQAISITIATLRRKLGVGIENRYGWGYRVIHN
jgi:DNA-binding response OmpR family regulator